MPFEVLTDPLGVFIPSRKGLKLCENSGNAIKSVGLLFSLVISQTPFHDCGEGFEKQRLG
jgi:hypothetical protein